MKRRYEDNEYEEEEENEEARIEENEEKEYEDEENKYEEEHEDDAEDAEDDKEDADDDKEDSDDDVRYKYQKNENIQKNNYVDNYSQQRNGLNNFSHNTNKGIGNSQSHNIVNIFNFNGFGGINKNDFQNGRERRYEPRYPQYDDFEERDEINEALMPGSKMIPLIPLLKATKSICKVHTPIFYGSGFLINLSSGGKNFYCLMSNEHIITKKMIEDEATIKFYYNNGENSKKIYLRKRFIKEFTYMDIDATVVEILPKDGIDEEYFLSPDYSFMNNSNEIKNYQSITIFQYPDNLYSSKGKIIEINKSNKYKFQHTASTEKGSSGSPIFLKNSTSVIGIHKGSAKCKKNKQINIINIGFFISPIYNYFRELNKGKMKLNKNISNNNGYNGRENKYNDYRNNNYRRSGNNYENEEGNRRLNNPNKYEGNYYKKDFEENGGNVGGGKIRNSLEYLNNKKTTLESIFFHKGY